MAEVQKMMADPAFKAQACARTVVLPSVLAQTALASAPPARASRRACGVGPSLGRAELVPRRGTCAGAAGGGEHEEWRHGLQQNGRDDGGHGRRRRRRWRARMCPHTAPSGSAAWASLSERAARLCHGLRRRRRMLASTPVPHPVLSLSPAQVLSLRWRGCGARTRCSKRAWANRSCEAPVAAER